MELKKLVIPLMLIGLSQQVHAGLDYTTVHSRANCLNNESITWWYLHPFNWRVVSIHQDPNYGHVMDTGFQYTWRAHAIHWGEGTDTGTWKVSGYHYEINYSKKVPFDTTFATFCNIIDGW